MTARLLEFVKSWRDDELSFEELLEAVRTADDFVGAESHADSFGDFDGGSPEAASFELLSDAQRLYDLRGEERAQVVEALRQSSFNPPADEVRAHLPGQHDQSTHNPHIGGGGGGRFPVSSDGVDLDTVENYTGSDYADVNHYLRTGKPRGSDPEDLEHAYESLSQSIQAQPRMTEEATVYRGVSDPDSFLKENATIRDHAFVSTTTNRELASEFAGPDGSVIEIVIPEGARVLDIDGLYELVGEESLNEGEILIDYYSTFETSRTDAGEWRLTLRAEP